jgi:hypothetical protein
LQVLNEEWERLSFHAGKLGDNFGGILAPAFTKALGWLNHLVDKMSEFVGWLDSGTKGANQAKEAIQILGGILVGAATYFTLAAGAAKAFSIGLGGLELALSPVAWSIEAIVVGLALAVDGFAVFKSAWEHFNDKGPRPAYPSGTDGPGSSWKGSRGGRVGRALKPGEPGFDYGQEITGPSADILKSSHAMGSLVDLLNRLPGGHSNRTTTVTVNSPVTITGNASPSAVVTAARDGIGQALTNAGLSAQAQTR